MCASPKRKSGALLINKTTSDAFKKPWPINHDNFTSFLLMNKTIIQQDAFVHTCVFECVIRLKINGYGVHVALKSEKRYHLLNSYSKAKIDGVFLKKKFWTGLWSVRKEIKKRWRSLATLLFLLYHFSIFRVLLFAWWWFQLVSYSILLICKEIDHI